MLDDEEVRPERRLRAGIMLWWWIGLALALAVRIVWMATLEVPESVNNRVEILLRQSVGSREQGIVATQNAASHTAATESDDLVTGLIDQEATWWKYVVEPGLRYLWQQFGQHPVSWHWWVGMWQALMQSLACAGVVAIAWQAFGSAAVSFVALLVMAFNPDGLLSLLTISDVPLMQSLLTNWLAMVLYSARRGGIVGPLCVGLLAGAMILIRAGVLLGVGVVFIWYVWQMRLAPRGWLASLIVVLALSNIIATWFARHWQASNEPTPLAAIFWRYHCQGMPPELAPEQKPSDIPWHEAARQVVWCWSEKPAHCLAHRIQVWTEFFQGNRARPGLAPSWVPTAMVLDWLPAWHILFCLTVLLGWRWSFARAKKQLPITVMALALPLAYSLGPIAGVRESWGFALPIFTLYAASGLLGAVPWLGARLFPAPEADATRGLAGQRANAGISSR